MPAGSGSFIKKVGSFVPGSALVLFGKWIRLFSAIHMTNPIWERWASSAALSIGTVLSLVSIYLYAEADKPALGRKVVASLVCFLVSLVLCYGIYFSLKYGWVDNEFFGGVLRPVVYIVCMTTLCLLLTFLAMYDQKTSHSITIVCLVLVVIALIAVVLVLIIYPGLRPSWLTL
jgi:hypothetical protein